LRDKIAQAAKRQAAMFDTILLLTGALEQVALLQLLGEHNPLLTVIPILDAAGLSDLDPDILHRARLIAFVTSVIVPGSFLSRLGYGAYNFHPGPPEYPGWAPAHFALYDGASAFGVTAHAMVEKVDAGPIIGVDRFRIADTDNVAKLEGRAYAHLARMFWSLSKALATQAEPFPALPVEWAPRKNTRRAYREICDIPLDISQDDLRRRLKVFGQNHFGMSPTIKLHGTEFRAVDPEPDARTESLG
jgi:methionyl-tRNA formyltransferase